MSALTFDEFMDNQGWSADSYSDPMNATTMIARAAWDAREPELQELRAEVERLRTNQIGWNDLEVTYVSAIHNLEDQLAAAEAEVERLREQLATLKAAWTQQQALHEAVRVHDTARLAAAERVVEAIRVIRQRQESAEWRTDEEWQEWWFQLNVAIAAYDASKEEKA